MKLSRRKFLVGSGLLGGGLILGFSLRDPGPVPGTREATFQPNAWLQITSDNKVIFQMAKAEMGQGVHMGMTTIIAEELDYDPSQIVVELAGVHPDLALGMGQVTGASMSTSASWDPLREAGAMARAMLISTAANRWGIDTNQCSTDNGVIINQTNKERLNYGDLVDDARHVSNDIHYELKEPAEYRWVGRSLPRNDSYIKSTGKAEFGMDVDLPNMKIAVVVRPPQFGGSLKSWNIDVVNEQPGVIRAFEIHSGVAIVADSYWEARKAANSMEVQWHKGPLAGLDSNKIRSEHKKALLEGEAHFAVEEGDIDSSFAEATQLVEAEYAAPFLAHTTMEPQNATALVQGEQCEMWLPSQAPDIARAVAAHFTGISQENIVVNSTFLGGGFGRRSYVDFAGEVAVIAQRLSGVPVKLIWSREDDVRHDFYRPASYHGIKGALDKDGNLLGWQHKVVTSSLIKGFAPNMISAVLPTFVPTNIARSIGRLAGDFIADMEPTLSEGAHIPYAVDNLTVAQVLSEQGIPVGFWRSVGHSHTAFVSESFMDEMAYAAKSDPVEFRRRHLKDKPRLLAVLNRAVENANWAKAPEGIYQGVAIHESFESFAAMVVEVSISDKSFIVKRVVAAVDCGLPITPEIIRAQVESAIVYGLSAAMKDPVTIEDGAVKQSNFHDLPVLRINEVPVMEVHIIESRESPTGIGEPGLPPVAPALANALFAASGQRQREMPFKLT